MSDTVRRLGADDEGSLAALLDRDPVVNLFLRGFLATREVDRGWWYGVGDPLRAVVLVVPTRVAVPFAPDPADGARLGAHLARQHGPTLSVGPREAVDALWSTWTGAAPTRRHDQRLYVLDAAPPPIPEPTGFRPGRVVEWPEIARGAARMEREDLGTDPTADRERFEESVRERLRFGRTWVVHQGGRHVFQINVGTRHVDGAQLGGTWVPPEARSRGLATAGVAALCRRLLDTGSPRVTLHVNEANGPALRVYEKVGFRPDAAYRLNVP
jgi:RimJ/RimL family protein N-acetyltransferase